MSSPSTWTPLRFSTLLWFATILTDRFPFVRSSLDVELSCRSGSGGRESGLLFPGEHLVISCRLKPGEETDSENSVLFEAGINGFHGRLTTTVTNSTFHKVFEWEDALNKKNNWEFIIKVSDLFEAQSDLKLPKIYRHTSLKWTLLTVFNSRFIPYSLRHHMIVSYVTTDPNYRFEWGDPIDNDIRFPFDQYQKIFVNLPCQPGSGLLILSSSSRILVAATWDAFKSDSVVRWYDATRLLKNATSTVETLVVYHASFSSDRLFLVTSSGAVASSSFSSMCFETDDSKCKKISYLKTSVTAEDMDAVWSSTEIFHSPACSNIDQILLNGDRVFLIVQLQNGTIRIVEFVDPVKNCSFVSDLPKYSSHATIFYDAHSNLLYVAYTNDRESKAYVASFINVKRFVWELARTEILQPDVLLARSTSLPPVFILLLGNSSILYSGDGGISFSQLYQLEYGEEVLSAVSHDLMKSAAFLFNDGRILIVRAGVDELVEARSDVTNTSLVVFDNDGSLHAIRITANNPARVPQIVSQPVILNSTGSCSLTLIPHQPALMESVTYLDVGDEFVLRATAYASPSRGGARFPLLKAAVSNARLLQTRVELTNISPFSQQIDVTIENSGHSQGTGSVTIMLRNAEQSCRFTSFTLTVAFLCPPRKRLVFDYSSFVDPENLLSIEEFVNLSGSSNIVRLLEKNYRPPSAIGISIPMSKNIYNFDSTTSRDTRGLDYGFAEKYQISDHCEGIVFADCGCNSAMKFSSLEKFSDCRERVYDVKYDTEYHINVSVVDEADYTNKKFIQAEYLVYLEELNGRSEDVYSVTDGGNRICSEETMHEVCSQYSGDAGKDYREKAAEYMSYGTGKILYNSTTMKIRFLGSGLFHFRITLSRGYSHCRLLDEFQVYVTNPPLSFPVGTIVRLTISVAMGAALVLIYMRSLARNVSKVSPTDEVNPSEKLHSTRRNNASHIVESDIICLKNKFLADQN